MTELQIILAVVILVFLPTIGGYGLCRLLKTRPCFSKCLLAGTVALWAAGQLAVVPMVFARMSFTAASNALLLIQIAFAASGLLVLLWKGRKTNAKKAKKPEPAPQPVSAPAPSEEDVRAMKALEEMALREMVRKGMMDMDGSAEKADAEDASFASFALSGAGKAAKTERAPSEEAGASEKTENGEKAGKGKSGTKRSHRVSDYLAFALMLLIIGVVIYQSIILQRPDEDDSRFVVNAVDMVRTDRMYLTNPATGKEIESFKGELAKDVIAPWAVYPASVARWLGVNPTVIMHSVIPILVIILTSLIYSLIGRKIAPGDLGASSFFVFLLWLINIFGYYSLYSPETFIMTRSWQGKAIVASFAIPMMLYLFYCLYDKPEGWGKYLCLLAVNLSMCFLSGTGLVIGAAMLGCYGLVYAIAKKKISILLKILPLCIPNAAYYYLYTLVMAGKI